jgi:hypothetical protein
MKQVSLQVIFKALDKNFQPADDIFKKTLFYDGFPENDSTHVKQNWIKDALCSEVAHPEGVFFFCKVLKDDAVLFEYSDFFAQPNKRVNIKWEWDEVYKEGIGITTFPDGQTVDPRSLVDFYTRS